MKYSLKKKYITGVAIPVSALKSERSCGIGEFADLKLFGDWCSSTGINLIQLLPVNDTGYQSSPYSALSAFALHPIYLRISDIPGLEPDKPRCKKIKNKWDKSKKIDFNGILKDKLDLLKDIYKEKLSEIKKDQNLRIWIKDNQWVKEYSVFSYLKEINNFESWDRWSVDKHIEPKRVDKLYNEEEDLILFYTWLQYNLEIQLKDASNYLESLGINLKGDLPILMNTDSCDVWYHREIFDLDHRAGAPPDMFSAEGQNWGFPTYFWKVMEKNDYSWWKARLKQAAKFYHAYRIDHVLGFFRIWSIPSQYHSGSMGYYRPNKFMTLKDLEDIGFDNGRIAWLTKPHIPGWELREKIVHESNSVIKIFLDQIGDEDLYLFKPEVAGVSDIYSCDEISQESKNELVNFYQNITILKVDKNQYIPCWYYQNSRGFSSLSEHEKYLLSEKLGANHRESMELWKNQGLKLLKFMKESEDMLVCAEDLGAVPDCVPEVLQELGILGLHVTRWSKKYKEEGEPFIKPTEYKYLSVSTPAVHDSSTVRQWWSEIDSLEEISQTLELPEVLLNTPTPLEVEKMYKSLLKTSSQIAMFQFQDLLAIDSELRDKNPAHERINIPGTTNSDNWSYRMSLTIEKLLEKKEFNNRLLKIIKTRKEKSK